MGGLSNGPIPYPHAPLTHTGGSKSPPLNFSQIGDCRLSTLCGVVERPDHHCDDDLVLNFLWPQNVFHHFSTNLWFLLASAFVPIRLGGFWVLQKVLDSSLDDLSNSLTCMSKVITTMVIRPLDALIWSWSAQSLVDDLRPLCLGVRGERDELIQ